MILIQLQRALVQTQRTYAAAATKGIKPPITIHTLEGTYASALFSSSAQNAQTLNDIEKSLMTIKKKLDADPKLQSVVVNPALSHREKLDVVQFLTQTGGGSNEASKAVKNLLEVMSENSRLGHLNGVVSAFEKIMRAHKGEVDVLVTSSQVRIQEDLFLTFSRWILVC
jgi:F-type H+-transporting ATPase subunit O